MWSGTLKPTIPYPQKIPNSTLHILNSQKTIQIVWLGLCRAVEVTAFLYDISHSYSIDCNNDQNP